MTDKVGEQLSAWMDGELPEEEVPLLLRRLEEDRDLRLRLQRYQLVRDALKGGLPEMINYQMADRVDAEIRKETLDMGQIPDEVSASKSWMRPLMGTAVAASVAVLAIVGVQMMSASNEGGPKLVPQQAVVQPPVEPAPTVQRAALGNSWEVSDPEVARRLNDYLINHSERVSTATMQGVPPHVRIVGFEHKE